MTSLKWKDRYEPNAKQYVSHGIIRQCLSGGKYVS